MADTGPDSAPTDSSDALPRRRRLVVAAAIAAVVVALVGTARTAGDATVAEVLGIPDLGTVRADQLTNGTPVFVVSTPAEDGGQPVLDVVQAFTTELEGPITGLVAWCADGGAFVDAHHGPLYDVRGRRLPTSLQGRELLDVTLGRRVTAVDDLIHRRVQTVEGRTAPDDPFTVGDVQPLQGWQVADRPALQPRTPPASCRLPDRAPGGDDDVDGPRVVDHAFLAGAVQPDARGWQITTGWLAVAPDGAVTWCDTEPTPLPDPGCPGPSSVEVGFELTADQTGGVAAVIGGPIAVRLGADGAVARAAVLAQTTWRGSSLRGTEVYAGRLVRSWSDDDPRIGVRGVQGGGPGLCLGAFPGLLTNQAAATRIPVTGDTTVDVDGTADVAGLDALARGQGRDVRVVVDAATCTALQVLAPS